MRNLGALLVLLVGVVGCKDEGVLASDYDGTWQITSLTVPTDSGLQTVRRDGTAQAIRGDAVFTATADDRGTLDVRQVFLVNGLIAGEVQTPSGSVLVEEDRWVLTVDASDVTVFVTARTGDHLVLTSDATDPRQTATDPPREVIVDRVTPWTTALVGNWALVSMTLPSGQVTAGACTQVQSGVWAKVEMAITISARQLFERRMTISRFDDAACTVPSGQQESTQVGYGEEEGATLRMWATEGDSSEYQEFTIATAADQVTLTRTHCLPAPDCEGEAPTEVVVRRVP